MAARFPEPRRWSELELEVARIDAISDFVRRRAAEGSTAYRSAFSKAKAEVERLMHATSNLTSLDSGAAFLADPTLINVARYLDGPPVSADDLAVVAEVSRNPTRIDGSGATAIARVVRAGLDAERFPWLNATPMRQPTGDELDIAVRWTAGLWAVQLTATKLRGESASRQENAVKALLTAVGFGEVKRRRIDTPADLAPGTFCPEALVAGAKCDVPVALRNGRLLLIECKVSSSAVNSVKRLNRETGGKAELWRAAFGAQASTAAVLAGVFRLGNLTQAQNDQRIYLYWERDLTPLADFVGTAF